MLRYILVFISLVYLPFAVKGQADVSFSQKFDWPTGYRETLPEWVFYAQTDTLIGISDPYLKPEVAKESNKGIYCFSPSMIIAFNVGKSLLISTFINNFFS